MERDRCSDGRGRICLYDDAAKAALGGAPVNIPSIRSTSLSAAQKALLDQAGALLAASTAAQVAAVRLDQPGCEAMILIYLPTVLDDAAPEATPGSIAAYILNGNMMMTEATDRLAMPFLAPGQAQKETTHNEALAIADMLVQPVVQAVALATPPSTPQPGQCWIVGAAPSGVWTGHAGAIACWTSGGWRFSGPFDGMQAWSIADGSRVTRSGGAWETGVVRGVKLLCNGVQTVGARQAAILGPAGGTTVDAQARLSIEAILLALRSHGLIET